MAGEGIALGWEHLCGRRAKSGELFILGYHTLDTGAGFYIVWPKACPWLADFISCRSQESQGPISE